MISGDLSGAFSGTLGPRFRTILAQQVGSAMKSAIVAVVVPLAVFALLQVAAKATPAACVQGLNYPGGDLPAMPVAAPSGAACADMCDSNPSCRVYTWHAPGCSDHGEVCPKSGGCCWLKGHEASQAISNCTCSGRVRDREGVPPAPTTTKNVLYILVDDLRPELEAYGRPGHNPNIKALADRSVVFDRAYCQIAVCSPSRNSFLSGLRPARTGATNFINHIRQARCTESGDTGVKSGKIIKTTSAPLRTSAAGQCCTDCSLEPACTAWVWAGTNDKGNQCTLYASVTETQPQNGAVYGATGDASPLNWTTFPQYFKQSGFQTCSTGKIFHTEEGGTGPSPWDGEGMPPNEDPPSWTSGCTMAVPNDPAPMVSCPHGSLCAIDADLDGNILDGTSKPLCDKVIGDDALAKLRSSKANLDATGRPFFLATGFRKPHLPFRFPKPYLDFLPAANKTDTAQHPVLDHSIPPIAYRDTSNPQTNPYEAVAHDVAQQWRQYYRASIAWMDHQVGMVLQELHNLGLENDTIVLLHADHGWSLGESGQWQKFTNFELGTRVPLMIHVPWIKSTQGTRTSAMTELIDVMPTVIELADMPAPPSRSIDGTSLVPVLKDPASSVKSLALSQYPRCPVDTTNASHYWAQNDCEFVDKADYPFMGYSIRNATWRYTEWATWNGSAPVWDKLVGRELYSHKLDNGTVDFDSFEVVNQVHQFPDVAAELSVALRTAFGEQ